MEIINHKGKYYLKTQTGYREVLATTDKSLTYLLEPHKDEYGDTRYNKFQELPQPSQLFIEKYVEEYNKGNIITEIMVEYEKANIRNVLGVEIYDSMKDDILKVNPKDNTITIKKVKDNWTREELMEEYKNLLLKAKSFSSGPHISVEDINKWIENL